MATQVLGCLKLLTHDNCSLSARLCKRQRRVVPLAAQIRRLHGGRQQSGKRQSNSLAFTHFINAG